MVKGHRPFTMCWDRCTVKTENIHSIDPPPARLDPQLDQPTHKPALGDERHQRSVIFETPPLDHIRFNKLEKSNARSQDMAGQIRNVHETMAAIDGHLQKMQSQLAGIVKMYPPYPPESSERIEALRQFSALRNMIDRLATPAGADDMHKILGDADLNPNAGDWQMPGVNPSGQRHIRHQPVHSGKSGLDLPEPGLNGTDDQLSRLFDRTTTARQVLLERRRAFISDANRLITTMS